MSDLPATADDIRYAYRLLLGREPDADGFAFYRRYLGQASPNAPDIAALFMGSPEFQARHPSGAAVHEVDFGGVKLFPWQGDRLIGALVVGRGEYEAHVLPRFLERTPVGGTVLDVGANIGIFTLTAARRVGPAGRVIAVEPVPLNVRSLCMGVAANGFRQVTVLPVAASGAAGVVPLLRAGDSSNGIVDVHVHPTSAEGWVPAHRLDVLLAGLDRLDVMKIDIEGHEPQAWPGIEDLVRRHWPVIFAEFNPIAIRNHSRVEPEEYLRALFVHAPVLDALHLDGTSVRCVSSAQVMEEWERANRDAAPGTSYHLDVIADTSVV